jgi:hypothetical protein
MFHKTDSDEMNILIDTNTHYYFVNILLYEARETKTPVIYVKKSAFKLKKYRKYNT